MMDNLYNSYVAGIILIIVGVYMTLINAPNYVGYIIIALGAAVLARPGAVKKLIQNKKPKGKIQKSKKK